ncbi:PRC-barrel domain-containing protein [Streptomyces sp. H28]|uniref:PRC-barrel domain-containing protein n=1 Tax=Streptomyces sp. H28 TaxID=2775865 RepID=UPI0017815B10|nr:PRC-barrel domain-containing protein [Streptomyces sp. H28]MBD9733406.1 PRC-barrel domain-containing protein [Streptomyces sp. H28]
MNELMAVRSLTMLPVVTLGGDAVAHVKDTLLDGTAGHVTGFTVTGRGLLSGPLRQSLPWPAVYSLGPDAVMVRDDRALLGLPLSAVRGDALRGRLLGARVVTEEGEPVGTVLDVLVEGGTSGRVAAFRLAAGRALVRGSRHHRHRAYLPRAEALSVSGRTLVVPAHATAYVADDLTGFLSRAGTRHDRARSAPR